MTDSSALTTMHPTPIAELNAVLDALITGVRPILGDNFVGAYLQGSFAVGDALSHSDVDFVVVVRADVPDAMVPALQAVHVQVYDLPSDWAKHLEGSYFPHDLLCRPETAGQPLLYIDNGSRVFERHPHDNTLVVRWILRERGVTLAGPPASSLLEPVVPDELRREARTMMLAWGQEMLDKPESINNDWAQPYRVLSFCRMLETLTTGQIHSKPAGAAWARRTLHPRWIGLIDRAVIAHTHQRVLGRQPADPADLAATLEFVREALAAAAKTAGVD
ncbi:MAG: aminoglycoside adenylyltransferase domain-containing protein [Anaerolineales bacterium]